MYSKKTLEAVNTALRQRRQDALRQASERQTALYSQSPRFREYDHRLRELTRRSEERRVGKECMR